MQTYLLFQYGEEWYESKNLTISDGHSDIGVTLNTYTHLGFTFCTTFEGKDIPSYAGIC